MFLRPGLIRLIPAIVVGVGWLANTALAYIRGSKILKEEESNDQRRDSGESRKT